MAVGASQGALILISMVKTEQFAAVSSAALREGFSNNSTIYVIAGWVVINHH
jgi:hypothetical protein